LTITYCLQQGDVLENRRRPIIAPFPRFSILAGAALLALSAPAGSAHDADETPAAAEGAPTRSMREYAIPAVRLVRDDGKVVSLPDEMDDGRPVVLNFIFTTCSSICPLMSSVLAQFERRLGADADKVHFMSLSIDPEHDTPARLREYADKFHAGLQWQHYTGTAAASVAAQRAFDVYRGGKMSHNAVTLMRAAPGKPWLRIEGLVTPDHLVRHYRELLAAP
jgi:protein SCO1/2